MITIIITITITIIIMRREVSNEIESCIVEAEELQPGWKEHIFMQAAYIYIYIYIEREREIM